MMHRFKDIEDASLGLATRIIEKLNYAIVAEGSASVVLTGGKSIQRTLQLLSDEELSWEKVTVILSDERYLDVDHPASNEKQLRQLFLRNHASNANYISLVKSDNTPEPDIDRVKMNLNAIKMPITVTVLVLGLDGHIASLFPGESRNWLAQSNCQIASSNNHEYRRITLTPNYICNSGLILLLVSDVERVNLCEALLDGGDEDEYPARILFNQNKTPVEIFSV